ncbi:hypothetical protein LOK49_LG01G01327 [Camellia lanceoleosa]|uniref:Uncharacterized protein n=1 Tax=Camellia lanceoleosa TaxID=1840588 RepID=A0ACC0J193_9ERIC|nr:hypothetical protein LOK49_LG01G01327 [Camellia lanceoleosa]
MGNGKGKGKDFLWHMSNVETWVSAALTDENTCLDGFSGRALDGNVKASIKARVTNVAQVTSNALALSSPARAEQLEEDDRGSDDDHINCSSSRRYNSRSERRVRSTLRVQLCGLVDRTLTRPLFRRRRGKAPNRDGGEARRNVVNHDDLQLLGSIRSGRC